MPTTAQKFHHLQKEPLRIQSSSPKKHPDNDHHHLLPQKQGSATTGMMNMSPGKTLEDYNLYKMSIHEKRYRMFELYRVFGMDTVGGKRLYGLFGEEYRKQGLKMIRR